MLRSKVVTQTGREPAPPSDARPQSRHEAIQLLVRGPVEAVQLLQDWPVKLQGLVIHRYRPPAFEL